MNIKPIKNNKDYKKALSRINKIWDAKEGTKAGDELEIISILVEKYEEEHFEILPPDPIEAIIFRMEQMGLEKKDLAEIIGANRSSEILHGKRRLTLKMIKDLHSTLKIPIDSLVGL